MDQEHIDALLERYLTLLDELTQLRERLSKLQSGVYHNIARANFSAERGLRYGQSQYDDRMQASRILGITRNGDAAPSFEVKEVAVEEERAEQAQDKDTEEPEGTEDDTESKNEEANEDETKAEQGEEQEEEQPVVKPVNPLRWFGILAPMPLRNAQSLSVEAVEQVIPRLMSVNAEMLNLEIEIRRARKKRSKATDRKAKTTSEMTSTEKQPIQA